VKIKRLKRGGTATERNWALYGGGGEKGVENWDRKQKAKTEGWAWPSGEKMLRFTMGASLVGEGARGI